MAFRGGHHAKETKRMNGCGSKSAQRRARRYSCNHGARIAQSERKRQKGGKLMTYVNADELEEMERGAARNCGCWTEV